MKNVAIANDLHKTLKTVAADGGMHLQDVVDYALVQWLEKHTAKANNALRDAAPPKGK